MSTDTGTVTKETETTNELVDLIDGENIQVVFNSKPGEVSEMETVRVMRIPIRKMDALAKAWGNPVKEVLVYTGKDQKWLDRLSDQSFGDVMEKGRQLNFTSFKRWFGWQMDTMKAMGKEDIIAKALGDALASVEQAKPVEKSDSPKS